jgi:hypothetical protein
MSMRDRSGLQAGQAGAANLPAAPVQTPIGGAAGAPYAGEPCRMGETAPCVCSPGSDGMKICRFDAASPTDGTYSGCENCTTRPPADNSGDVMTRAGSGGASSRSAAGSGGTGGARTGSGGRGEGESGGRGGQRPSGCMSECTNICFPVGILPCCNLLGICGCTWAPGAYCL